MNSLRTCRLHLLVCVLSLSPFAVMAADHLTADRVLSIDSAFIELKDSQGAVVDKIQRSWVVNLVTVSQHLSQAYRLLMPTLVIGKLGEPNALVALHNSDTLLIIDTEMLRLIREDEDLMAALIGHELAHLRKSQWRHGHAVRSLFVVDRLSAAAATDPRMKSPVLEAKTLSTRFAASGSSVPAVGFSAEQEREVDTLTIRTLTTAGYDPDAVTRFWREMQGKGRGGEGAWLIEHPLDAARLHAMQSLAASLADIYAASRASRQAVESQLVLFGARLARMPATSVGLEGATGVMVAEVQPQSPAAVAGIVRGDILLRLDGTELDKPEDVKAAVADVAKGSRVEVKLLRRAVPVWVHLQL